MNTSISDLKTKGFVVVHYPSALRAAVGKTTESWKKFCALPVETKKSLPYSNGGAGIGYELKEGIGAKADRKENCDVTLAGKAWLEEHAASIKNPIALDFVENASALVSLLKPVILDFARQAEKAFGLEGFADEVDRSEDAFFVRFIHYFGDRRPEEETAAAHADQSGFTLHLFESAAGLQCLTFGGKALDGTTGGKISGNRWIDMPVSEGETVIIPSMQMQLRSKGELKALCHRVVANPETAAAGRYSAVCFVQLKNTPKYDKDRHGRLQEKNPGFNYAMPHEEFAKLFKK